MRVHKLTKRATSALATITFKPTGATTQMSAHTRITLHSH
jgi:hypothetical protein